LRQGRCVERRLHLGADLHCSLRRLFRHAEGREGHLGGDRVVHRLELEDIGARQGRGGAHIGELERVPPGRLEGHRRGEGWLDRRRSDGGRLHSRRSARHLLERDRPIHDSLGSFADERLGRPRLDRRFG